MALHHLSLISKPSYPMLHSIHLSCYDEGMDLTDVLEQVSNSSLYFVQKIYLTPAHSGYYADPNNLGSCTLWFWTLFQPLQNVNVSTKSQLSRFALSQEKFAASFINT